MHIKSITGGRELSQAGQLGDGFETQAVTHASDLGLVHGLLY